MSETRVLPLRVGILPGEGLHSWLEALARRNGLTFPGFLSVLGLPRDYMTRRLVTGIASDQLRILEARTGLPAGRLDQAVVRPGFPFGPQRQRRCRFCPQCLAERERRWTLSWWMPWTFACLRHGTLLHDECPGCGEGVRVRLPSRTHLTPPATCTWRPDGQSPVCGTDLTGAEPLLLAPSHPLLAAQRWVDEQTGHVDAARAHAMLSDLHACTVWVMRTVTEADLAGMGPLVVRSWSLRPRDLRSPAQRVQHLPAAVRGVIAHTARPLLDGDEAAGILALRSLRERQDTKGKVIPKGMTAAHWTALSSAARSRFLRAGDRHMGAIDRLRYLSPTPHAQTTTRGDARVTGRVRHLPQLLWPGWSVRLIPQQGMKENLFRGIASALLLMPREAARSSRQVTDRLHPHLPNAITVTLQRSLHSGHPDVLTALCSLAVHLDEHGSPIDYERRRTAVPPAPLTEDTWRQMCFTTGCQPGDRINAKAHTPRYVHAQRYLYQLLTGADLHDPRYPLSLKNNTDRGRYLAFTFSLTTPQREALHDHGRTVLDGLGIDEPLTWEPPHDLADGLDLPGRNPHDIDLDTVHRIVIAEQRAPGDAARELNTTLAHIRFALEHVATEPQVWTGKASPLAAWRLRERARQIFTSDFLHREYTEGGKTLTQIARATGFPRYVVVEHAQAHSITIYRTRRPTPIDEDWLREQYLTRKRSTGDIAREVGVENETIRRRLRQLDVPLRPQGVHSRTVMLAPLDTALPHDIRRAVEGTLHGWHRLHRFHIAMAFPSLETAASYLKAERSALVTQFQRLERDLGTDLFHRSAFNKPQRPSARGQVLLRDLAHERVQELMRTALTSDQFFAMPDEGTLARAMESLRTRRPPSPLRPYDNISVPRIRIRAETLTLLRDLVDHAPTEFFGSQVSARTGLNQGSISDRLRQLEQAGWLASRPEDDASWLSRATPGRGAGRRRTYYTLTAAGRRAAEHELQQRAPQLTPLPAARAERDIGRTPREHPERTPDAGPGRPVRTQSASHAKRPPKGRAGSVP
ncbi:TniQ family protein [Streptomyces sviceus]|uniref:TniQ family protein n=1 Tax=Streptomyces sviceus TaxID=285530 RepID=UPI0036C4B1D6